MTGGRTHREGKRYKVIEHTLSLSTVRTGRWEGGVESRKRRGNHPPIIATHSTHTHLYLSV